jgi:hypothetical protein
MACITLLSDLGLQDATVAIAKGILLQYWPEAHIIDISHEVQPFQMGEAAYLLHASYSHFPADTYHVVLFDIYSADRPELVIAEQGGHYFLAPDNGILPLAMGSNLRDAWGTGQGGDGCMFGDWVSAAGLAINALSNADMAGLHPIRLRPAPAAFQPVVEEQTIMCEVIHTDQYENVTVNVTEALFREVGQGRPFTIQFKEIEEIAQISEGYTYVREGYKLCRFNSSGYMEICINRGKAASLFGLRMGSKSNGIKIVFE